MRSVGNLKLKSPYSLHLTDLNGFIAYKQKSLSKVTKQNKLKRVPSY